MIKTVIVFLGVLASVTAHAMPDFSLSLGNDPGKVVVSPNQPQWPFFLTEVWRMKSNGSWERVGVNYGSSAVIDTVPSSGTYVYRTRWYNPSASNPWEMFSSYSQTRTIVVSLSGPPTQAPSLSVPSTETNDGTFSVSWGNIAGATAYDLQRKSDGGQWSTAYSGPNTSRSQTLVNGVYMYRVRGRNSDGVGPFSMVRSISVNVNTQAAPPAPASTFSPTDRVIAWSSVGGAAYYELEANGSNLYTGSSTGHYIGIPTPSTWRVRACNSGGNCSAWTYGTRSNSRLR